MSNSVVLFLGAAGSGVILLILALRFLHRGVQRARERDRRLTAARQRAMAFAPESDDRGQSDPTRLSPQTLSLALLQVSSKLVPVGAIEREKLTQMLRQAGFGRQDALSLFLSLKLSSGLVLATCFGWLTTYSDTISEHGFFIAIAVSAGLVIGSIVPEYGLRALISRRLHRMSTTLPDALDLMVICLESGLTFERGLATIAEALMPIERSLADEFRLIEVELRLASDRRTVLEEYYQRTKIDGLRDFTMSLLQNERYGTPLAQSMKNIAASERARRAAQIVAKAERLPVLMTLPMLLFVVPGTMILVAGPAVLTAINALVSLGG